MILDDLQWPDPREAVYALLDGADTPQGRVTARYEQAADHLGQPVGPWPEAVIWTASTSTGEIDRAHEVVVEVFSPRGPEALQTAEALVRLVAGVDVSAGGVYVDLIQVRTGPDDIPYQHPVLAKTAFTLDVVVRPID